MDLYYDKKAEPLIEEAKKIDAKTNRKERMAAMRKIMFTEFESLGAKYDGDYAFKGLARRHQAEFRIQELKCNKCLGYGVNLIWKDMKAGKNFYDGFNQICFNEARNRYPEISDKVYGNMLRSEHIPINLFVPLTIDLDFFTEVMRELCHADIQKVTKFMIEHKPGDKEIINSDGTVSIEENVSEYLNDHTAFDAYFEFEDSHENKCAAGIEIKYTELEYGLPDGSHQKEQVTNLFTGHNLYYERTCQSGIYTNEVMENFKDESIVSPQNRTLTKDRYRQYWRNQMLGESMVEKKEINSFVSLLFYPKGNIHFEDTAEEYIKFLAKPEVFQAIQYEQYFNVLEKCLASTLLFDENTKKQFSDWIAYLRKRYIVEAK